MNRPPQKPTGVISNPNSKLRDESYQAIREAETEFEFKSPANSVMDIFKPFIFDGLISLSNDESQVYKPVKILRDTGASQSLILTNTPPFSKLKYSGNNILLRGVDSNYRSIPLHDLKLQSNLVTGDVTTGVIEPLPFDGIHLLLGND